MNPNQTVLRKRPRFSAILFSILVLASSPLLAQVMPFITISGQPGGSLEGYPANVIELYGDVQVEGYYDQYGIPSAGVDWRVVNEFDMCLAQYGESASMIAVIDIRTPSGAPFVSSLFSAPVNGSQFVSVGSRIMIGELLQDAEGCGTRMTVYRFEVLPSDADNDGVPDSADNCASSDLRPTIILNGVDTGVINDVLAGGCTLSDLIYQAIAEATGNVTNEVVALLVELKRAGIISGQEMGSIIQNLPHP